MAKKLFLSVVALAVVACSSAPTMGPNSKLMQVVEKNDVIYEMPMATPEICAAAAKDYPRSSRRSARCVNEDLRSAKMRYQLTVSRKSGGELMVFRFQEPSDCYEARNTMTVDAGAKFNLTEDCRAL